MATVSTQTWDSRINKRPSMLSLLNSPLKIYTASVTFGATESYVAGGIVVDLKADGKIKEYFAVIPIYNSGGLIMQYDTANEKVKVYSVGGTETTTLTSTRSVVAEFLVIGV